MSAVAQSEWQSGEPDESGYYLAKWEGADGVRYAEVWFAADANPEWRWWWTNGYTGESIHWTVVPNEIVSGLTHFAGAA